MKKQNAFTLIELSIALVIIGLIVGGVLVGKDLIKAAEFRAQISQIEKFTVASNTFKVKYNCLAGDCINATQFGFTGCTGDQTKGISYNGNGNGILAGVEILNPDFGPLSTTQAKENYNFWFHLNQAGLINETVAACGVYGSTSPSAFRDTTPKPKIGLDDTRVFAGYVAGSYAGTINLGNVFILTRYTDAASFSPALTPIDAQYIDTKADDGKPQTGKIHVSAPGFPWSNTNITFTGENTDNTWCTHGAANVYLSPTAGLNDGTLRCTLGFQFMP